MAADALEWCFEMLVHVGDDRTVVVDLTLAVWLSAVAGAVNAAGFHAIGFFSANMTGNASALSDHLALGEWPSAAFFLGLIAAFVLGAFVSALLIEIGRRRRMAGIYALSVLLEACLLVVAGLLDVALESTTSGAVVVIALSFIMGLQNSATTRISNARVRTTHVSGIVTDIGIELAVLLGAARSSDERSVVKSRLALHAATLTAFVGGGVAGVLTYSVISGVVLLISAAILFAIAIPELRKARGDLKRSN